MEAVTDDDLTVDELIRMTMRTGEIAIAVMKKLDEANTEVYGNPAPHKRTFFSERENIFVMP